MKKLLLFLVAGLIIGCATENHPSSLPESNLKITITVQPKGGQNVQTLSCTYQGYTKWCISGDNGDIDLAVEWEKYNSTNEYWGMVASETKYFKSAPAHGSTSPVQYTTTFSETAGYFNGKYRVNFGWNDFSGIHFGESGEAVCTVDSGSVKKQ